MRAAPRLISALVLGPQHRPTNVETSGHALRRTTEDENWGGAQTGGPRIQGYPGGRSLSGRIFEGVYLGAARMSTCAQLRRFSRRQGGFLLVLLSAQKSPLDSGLAARTGGGTEFFTQFLV